MFSNCDTLYWWLQNGREKTVMKSLTKRNVLNQNEFMYVIEVQLRFPFWFRSSHRVELFKIISRIPIITGTISGLANRICKYLRFQIMQIVASEHLLFANPLSNLLLFCPSFPLFVVVILFLTKFLAIILMLYESMIERFSVVWCKSCQFCMLIRSLVVEIIAFVFSVQSAHYGSNGNIIWLIKRNLVLFQLLFAIICTIWKYYLQINSSELLFANTAITAQNIANNRDILAYTYST